MAGRAFFRGWKNGLRRNGGRFSFPQWGVYRKPLFRRGQATLEILVVMIILIPLIFGGIELSRAVTVKASLDSGVATAVRLLALDPNDWGRAANVVATTVAHNVFGEAGLGTVNFGAVDAAGVPLTQGQFAALTYGDLFCIRGWVNYTARIPLISLDTITIRVEHCGVVEAVD